MPSRKTQEHSHKKLEDLFFETLKDIYFAEKQILRALPKMAREASSPELKQAFETHRDQTEGHVERLNEVFEQLGKPARGKTCEAILGIIEEAKEIMEDFKGAEALDAGLASSAQAVEHYEIARYGTLKTWAKELGLSDAAKPPRRDTQGRNRDGPASHQDRDLKRQHEGGLSAPPHRRRANCNRALIARLRDPAAFAILEAESPPLGDRRVGRLRRRDACDQRHQRPRHAAVRDDERVSGQSAEPGTHALGEHRVALSAGRGKIPFVLFARPEALGIARLDFRPPQAFPGAEAELLQDRIEPVAPRREAHRLARDLHRLPRALERRGDESLRRLQPLDLGGDPRPKRPPDRPRLLAPARVERGVALSLKPVLGVVRRLAVAQEDEAMGERRHEALFCVGRLKPRAFLRA